ncbi:MAG: transglycosylase SLT domain-containing protein [Betaproteobacteria bacterium]|nr:lytic transglycosylase domain-containing protein [Betaproteobacteria bacterium]MDE2047090.1 transglycosylase SLT domain-containing protein [Betaproteobacteria bacterium]
MRSYLKTARTVARDVGDGIIATAHNTLALIGFVVLLAAALTFGRPENRVQVEQQVFGWLQQRYAPPAVAHVGDNLEPSGAGLVLQAQIDDLPTQQKRVAEWLSRRYRIAPDPMAHMVAAAYDTAARLKLDPLLLLSVAAVESSFNPFVQSGVGAQGLMQVMSDVHEDKFQRFGGTQAAWDPVTSIKVGAVILKEYVLRAGSVEGGLKLYVGAGNAEGDGGYGGKVLAERARLAEVAQGKHVSPFVPIQPLPVAPTAQVQPVPVVATPAAADAAAGAQRASANRMPEHVAQAY